MLIKTYSFGSLWDFSTNQFIFSFSLEYVHTECMVIHLKSKQNFMVCRGIEHLHYEYFRTSSFSMFPPQHEVQIGQSCFVLVDTQIHIILFHTFFVGGMVHALGIFQMRARFFCIHHSLYYGVLLVSVFLWLIKSKFVGSRLFVIVIFPFYCILEVIFRSFFHAYL